MARLGTEETQKLEDELVAIFHTNPSESYRDALERIHQRFPEMTDSVTISDLNYRVPKLRRAGRIPGSRRGSRGGAGAQASTQHPVARAYQELDDARQAMDVAKRRYEQAEAHLRTVLKESLPSDFLDTLVHERSAQD